jgi:hypothetical protein
MSATAVAVTAASVALDAAGVAGFESGATGPRTRAALAGEVAAAIRISTTSRAQAAGTVAQAVTLLAGGFRAGVLETGEIALAVAMVAACGGENAPVAARLVSLAALIRRARVVDAGAVSGAVSVSAAAAACDALSIAQLESGFAGSLRAGVCGAGEVAAAVPVGATGAINDAFAAAQLEAGLTLTGGAGVAYAGETTAATLVVAAPRVWDTGAATRLVGACTRPLTLAGGLIALSHLTVLHRTIGIGAAGVGRDTRPITFLLAVRAGVLTTQIGHVARSDKAFLLRTVCDVAALAAAVPTCLSGVASECAFGAIAGGGTARWRFAGLAGSPARIHAGVVDAEAIAVMSAAAAIAPAGLAAINTLTEAERLTCGTSAGAFEAVAARGSAQRRRAGEA